MSTQEICVCGASIRTDDSEALTGWQAAHGRCGDYRGEWRP